MVAGNEFRESLAVGEVVAVVAGAVMYVVDF